MIRTRLALSALVLLAASAAHSQPGPDARPAGWVSVGGGALQPVAGTPDVALAGIAFAVTEPVGPVALRIGASIQEEVRLCFQWGGPGGCRPKAALGEASVEVGVSRSVGPFDVVATAGPSVALVRSAGTSVGGGRYVAEPERYVVGAASHLQAVLRIGRVGLGGEAVLHAMPGGTLAGGRVVFVVRSRR